MMGYLPKHEVIGKQKQPLTSIIYTGEECTKVYSSLLCTFISHDYAKDNFTFALQYLTLNHTLSWKPLRLSIVQIKICKNIQHKGKLSVVLQPPK